MPVRAVFGARVVISLLIGGVVLASAADAEAQRRRRRPPAGDGTLVLMVPAPLHGSEVLVDEESVGFAPVDPLRLSPGSHTVRVRRPGYTEFDDVVEIQPGQETELMIDMIPLAMVLTVRSVPDEARVFVDGTFRGSTPLELELIDGEHSIRVTAARYHEAIRTVTAVPGQIEAIDVELEAMSEEELTPRALEWYEEPVVWIAIGGGVVAAAAIIITIAYFVASSNPQENHCGGDPGCFLEIQPEDIGWFGDGMISVPME